MAIIHSLSLILDTTDNASICFDFINFAVNALGFLSQLAPRQKQVDVTDVKFQWMRIKSLFIPVLSNLAGATTSIQNKVNLSKRVN